jgi:hypothetical protein
MWFGLDGNSGNDLCDRCNFLDLHGFDSIPAAKDSSVIHFMYNLSGAARFQMKTISIPWLHPRDLPGTSCIPAANLFRVVWNSYRKMPVASPARNSAVHSQSTCE